MREGDGFGFGVGSFRTANTITVTTSAMNITASNKYPNFDMIPL
jgi:hypothetical protein